jgi:hypothetical protein
VLSRLKAIAFELDSISADRSAMEKQNISAFYEWLGTRLAQKGYVPLGPVHPLDLAFFKAGAFGPKVVSVTDTGHVSNTPTEIFQQVESWFQTMIGHGAGALLFVYHSPPPVTTIEEIQNISGQVVAGAHDLHTGKHWLRKDMNFEQEIYGE